MKYESKCLNGNLSSTAGDNNVQLIDRGSLSRLLTQSTNYLDYNVVKYALKIE